MKRYVTYLAFFLLFALQMGSGCSCGGSCPDGQDKCGTESCIDLSSNVNHCGSCDTACKAGERCEEGTCRLTCQQGLTVCKDKCVNTQKDTENCGACGTKCQDYEKCQEGKCVAFCGKGLSFCDEKCVNTMRDTENCGACGNKCESYEKCQEGNCVSFCGKDQTNCADKCVDTKKDPDNCGACGNQCKGAEKCVDGKCTLTCPTNQTNCSGSCVDTKKDPDNCGACGKQCKDYEKCVSGKCEIFCTKGQTLCSYKCVDTNTDNQNCGKCGNVCSNGAQCRAGKCEIVCPTGFTLCKNRCVDLQRDRDNCGACGTSCAAGEICKAGKCEIVCQKGLSVCKGICVDLQKDAKNCGACGTTCKTLEDCSAGKCVLCPDCPIWLKSPVSGEWAVIRDIAMDSQNNLYVAGAFTKSIVVAGKKYTSFGGRDIFLMKLDSNGKLIWFKQFGSSNLSGDDVYGVRVSKKGFVYIAGFYYGKIQFGKVAFSSKGYADMFVAKFDLNGKVVWAKSYGQKYTDAFYGMTLSGTDIYLTGRFASTIEIANKKYTAKGSYDAFLMKINDAGLVQWFVPLGGKQFDFGHKIFASSQGRIYLTGSFYNSLSAGSFTVTSKGKQDVFIARFDTSGKIKWLKSFGGADTDDLWSIVEHNSKLYVSGYFRDKVTVGTKTISSYGGADQCIVKMSIDGKFEDIYHYGGIKDDNAIVIGFSPKGHLYSLGYFKVRANFGSDTRLAQGDRDVSLLKMTTDGKVLRIRVAGGISIDSGYAMVFDSKGDLYVVGIFSDIFKAGRASLSAGLHVNSFIMKYQTSQD